MNDNRTRIDEAIDRAVRDIMRREPPAGFRGRVLSRLDEPARRSVSWPRLAMAAGALAVVVLAAVVLRDAPRQPASGGPQIAGSRPEAAPAPIDHVRRQAPQGAPAVERPAARAPRAEPVRTATFGPRDGRIAAANLTTISGGPTATSDAAAADMEPAASTLPPIVVPPLTPPGPIEIAPIVVPPIPILRMQLAPASPPR